MLFGSDRFFIRFNGGCACQDLECILINYMPLDRKTLSKLKIAIVGDCHGQWSLMDIKVLYMAKPDLVLFVGDISDGNIKTIKLVNSIEIPTFVFLGNHDRGKDHSGETLLKQIRILKEKFCGWDLKIFDNKINIIGGRPCSSGGGYFLSKEILNIYGPVTEFDSADRIIKSSKEADEGLPLIMLAHAGPVGLGSEANSICGKDWKSPACDWGDRDLAIALNEIQKERFVDLVVFGHMHHKLKRNLGFREMFKLDKRGTAYLNAAIVPRYKKKELDDKLFTTFSWVEFNDQKLTRVSQRWYTDEGHLHEEKKLFDSKAKV